MNSNPLEKFYHWERTTPDNLFLRQPIDGQWHEYSFAKAGNEIRRIAASLKAMNLLPGSNVAILSKNCAHWIMADLAIWMAGHISVPIYPSLSASAVNYVLEHSEAKVVFVGKLDDYPKQRPGIPESIKKISFPVYGPGEGMLWEELITQPAMTESTLPSSDKLATIIYSSGTTGTPKGVMLTFGAMDFFGKSAIKSFGVDKAYPFFSYLPLAHIAERAYIEIAVLYSGSNIAFAESLEKFPQNLSEVKPVMFGGVPRIYAKFQEGILGKLPQKKLNIILSIPIINGLMKNFIQKKLGLNRAKKIVCGAAPIPISLLKWYQTIGINIHEVYGMTENCGYSHGDHGEHLKYGTVGRAWEGVECKFSDEGEILMKHGALLTGYYKDPETTASVFTTGGFFRTGDKGMVDQNGFLTITGRLKDQFKTDKGKFIAPAAIEMKLLANPYVEQVCVVGSGVPQPIALITLSAIGKIKTKEELTESLEVTLKQTNTVLESFERLAKAVIMKQEWTIDNGLLTPTLKVKRNEVEKIHLPMYPAWYKMDGTILWE
ncbi:MAG: AMP-binding protein [Cyclobacteriaceae bacterium]|nr:AMP-binding protein [Cyclobacteriaceae bacterium]